MIHLLEFPHRLLNISITIIIINVTTDNNLNHCYYQSDCYDEHYFYDYYWPCQHHHAIISQCYYHIMYRHHYLLLPWRPWWWHEFVHMDLYPIENDNQPSNWGHTIVCNEIWGTHEWLSLSPIDMTYIYIYIYWYILNFRRRFFGSNERQWNGIYIYISYIYIYIVKYGEFWPNLPCHVTRIYLQVGATLNADQHPILPRLNHRGIPHDGQITSKSPWITMIVA